MGNITLKTVQQELLTFNTVNNTKVTTFFKII
jgi:hypothetical protein